MKQSIFPSIVAKDQKELDQLLKKLQGTSKTFHLDIVDGKFADNHSLDFDFKLPSKYKYQAHLMVQHPEQWLRRLSQLDLVIPHFEMLLDVKKYLQYQKKRNKIAALALDPETSANRIKPYARMINLLLILTVPPGNYGGQFLSRNLNKIKYIKKSHPHIKIMVDGGMDLKTIIAAQKAGADYFITGHFAAKAKDPKVAMKLLQKALKR